MNLAAALLAAALPALATAQNDTVESIDKNFAEAPDPGGWIYNDLDRGISEAKASGKPLMVVYRCIP